MLFFSRAPCAFLAAVVECRSHSSDPEGDFCFLLLPTSTGPAPYLEPQACFRNDRCVAYTAVQPAK